ncbi:DNA endonuclease RBBP8 [Exaiptasia diaphana]|uniref:DNA endonuclease activator Ctp1 C-terminal domain-containing protein n=1 Tax=Exaiptasia diaphana TaxID=2652724 RepID=A0A913WU94_EXADI|nr:DNA endonuclease RBBP8 [Exaiptasia diaphana]KXJ20958.1 DNA endonuclease RBBP8 [Exaiptasia diaphana]
MPKRGRERWKDPAYTCRDCEKYYESFPKEEREKRIQNSCRHRSEAPPPPKTPPHLWEVDFPTTPEYMAAGWLRDGDATGHESQRPKTEYGRRKYRRYFAKKKLDTELEAKQDTVQTEDEKQKTDKN